MLNQTDALAPPVQGWENQKPAVLFYSSGVTSLVLESSEQETRRSANPDSILVLTTDSRLAFHKPLNSSVTLCEMRMEEPWAWLSQRVTS